MKVLLWHVHGSWTTSFVAGGHDYLLPVLPDRSADGRGRARTWNWPATAREVTPDQLGAGGEARPDVVVLQRPHEADLLQRWTGLRAGVDVRAVYLEHNAPHEHAATTRHPLADRSDIPVMHVTAFNALMWDTGLAPVHVIEHGVADPAADPAVVATGERESAAVLVNEPVRRWRVAGTDLLLAASRQVGVQVYGMGMDALVDAAPHLAGRVHEDYPQARVHVELARHRAYLHPYRWTSLGLSLVEAMMIGLPVAAVATTAAPHAVPAEAGVVSPDLAVLVSALQRWMSDPREARERGQAARSHALEAFSLKRFLAEWEQVLSA